MLPSPPVILASASPRRRELLQALIPEFEVVPADIDESALTTDDPWETATSLALAKARAVAQLRPNALVIGSDTVVALEGRGRDQFVQLAKPDDRQDAKRMLQMLSDREHVVITGLALVWPEGEKMDRATTTVRFRKLNFEEIEAYVASGEPMDKAGAYAIQGGAKEFVESVEGSLTNVIGLPMELLESMLEEL